MKPFVIPSKPAAPARRARNTGETPPSERKAAERVRLAESGGRQIAINLPGDAAADLAAIQERDGLSIKEAVIQALRREAKRKR